MMRRAVTILLLAFVAASVGYLVAQGVGWLARPGGGRRGGAASAPASPARPDRAIVYYLHDAQRCDTCLLIERMTRGLLDRDFAADLKSGRVEWRPVVIEEDRALAKRFDAASASVVVAAVRDGNETGFLRMDDLWKVMDEPNRFDARVGDAIRRRLPEARP